MAKRKILNCEICHSFFHSTKEHKLIVGNYSDKFESLKELKIWLDEKINRSNARVDIWSAKITECYEEVKEQIKILEQKEGEVKTK